MRATVSYQLDGVLLVPRQDARTPSIVVSRIFGCILCAIRLEPTCYLTVGSNIQTDLKSLLEETNGTFVGGHKFLTSRSSVVHTIVHTFVCL